MLDRFIEYVNKNKLAVDSVIITQNGNRCEHFFTDVKYNNIRSISKTITCLGAYKAMEKGFYSIDTPVLPFFDRNKITNKSNLPCLEQLRIGHLLNMSIGQEKGLMFRKDTQKMPADTDFLYYILNYDMKHAPGTGFVYNNAAAYLLCAVTQQAAGEYFGGWMQKELFDAMDIVPEIWEKTQQGICLGASGLRMTNRDLHKIALLFLNEGSYKEKQLVSPDWIRLMHTPQIFTAELPAYADKQDRCLNKMAYGYGMWICGDGSPKFPKTYYFSEGTDGQFMIISPEKQTAMTILSHQADMAPFYEILSYYIS